jgi:hypothetical protein
VLARPVPAATGGYSAAVTDDRRAALDTMTGRFPAVAERFQRVYGLRLPGHMAVAAAFWASLTPAERSAVDRVGLRPFGINDYFGDDGPRLVGRDGLDERLHCRYRRDPAEFVTVMSGHSDGLHFGLWYDDPAELPTFIAHNYARDSAETTTGYQTVLGELRLWVGRVRRDMRDNGEDPGTTLDPLVDALDWFAEPDQNALADDGKRRWATARRPSGGITIGPALPRGSGDPRTATIRERLKDYRTGPTAAARHIAQAEAELADGRPAFALTVGSELHWCDHDDHNGTALALLTGAYRALGRDALAEIVEVHHAHRDLRSVTVLTRP